MKKRAILTVEGDVQEVGYRSAVMKIAQKLRLVGYVENLPNGAVKVVCEGEESQYR
jgi:acylphosphatase